MLAECGLPVVDRAVIQTVFGLGRRQAIEFMHRFGGYEAGHTLLIERGRLIAELDVVASSGEYRQETARREKLTAALSRFRRPRRAEEVRIGVTAEVFGARMPTLPEAVHLQPGRLEIEFSGSEDLLTKLFTLAQVAANDYEGFQKASEVGDRE